MLLKVLTYLHLCVLVCFVACKKQTAVNDPQKGFATSLWLDSFTKVQYGTMPLVITVPHGGTVSPDSLADRSCPGITTAVDLHTIEMAKAIDSVAFADYGLHPFIVYTNLKRTKVDQNRQLAEATCSNPAIYRYWYNFHDAVDSCIQRVLNKYPQCLYIDLHAHGHTLQRLELGYLVSKSQLQNLSSVSPSITSLANLFNGNNFTLPQILTGTKSFGTLMAAEGYPSVPSASIPATATADPYFDGGYNTQRYAKSAKTFGWQIESNYTGVRENYNQRSAFAKAFLRSVMTYYKAFTSLQPEQFGY